MSAKVTALRNVDVHRAIGNAEVYDVKAYPQANDRMWGGYVGPVVEFRTESIEDARALHDALVENGVLTKDARVEVNDLGWSGGEIRVAGTIDSTADLDG